MKKKKAIALTWGWSWGHIIPLVALYNYIKENKWDKYNFIWIWEKNSLEEEIAKQNNIKFLNIPSWKIRRYFDIKNFYEPLKNIIGIFYWIYYIIKNKVDIVFSKGGYVSIPLCISAFILRKKIYIHESDIMMWLANKLISKIATKVFSTFPNKQHTDNPKYITTWQILNPKLIESLDNYKIKENQELNVIVIAWSQWSTIIFKNLLKILPELQDIKFHIILWSKNTWFRKDFEEFKNAKTYDFIPQDKLGKILKNIDIAITRWSATTLWELHYFWIHSIIIPITNAWNHQQLNADFFHENYWSDSLDENKNLDKELLKLLEKHKNLRKTKLNLDWYYEALEKIDKEIIL